MAIVRVDYKSDNTELVESNKILKELDKSTEEAQKSSKSLEGQTETTNQAFGSLSDQLKNVANNFTIAGKGAGDLATGMFRTANATTATSKSLKVLRTALIATGIGAVVVLLGSLVTFLTKTTQGSEKLRRATAALNGIIDILTQKFGELGAEVFKFIEENEELNVVLKGTLDFLLALPGAIAKTLSGFVSLGTSIKQLFTGDFKAAAESALEGITQIGQAQLDPLIAAFTDADEQLEGLTAELKAAAEASINLQKAQDNLRVSLRDSSVEIANLIKEEERLLAIRDDATRSLEEREKAGLQAEVAAEKRAQAEVKAARDVLKVAQLEFNTRRALSFEERQTLLDNIAEARVAVIESETELTRVRLEAQKERAQLDQDQFEQRLDFLFDLTDAEKAINERQIADQTLSLERRKQILEETVKFNADSFARIEEEFQKQAKNRIDTEKLLQETNADRVFEELKLAGLSEIERQRFLEFLREQKLAEQDLAEARRDIQEEELERDKKAAEERIKLQQEVADARIALEKDVLDTSIGFLQEFGAANGRFAAGFLLIEKTFAVAQIIIDLQKELSAIAVNAAANPLNSVTGGASGLAQFASLSAIAKTRAALGIGTVAAQTISGLAGFKEGVIDLMGAGTETSDSILARLSKGESVMTAQETRNFMPTLSAIRKGDIDPEILNGVVRGQIGGSEVINNLIEVPTTKIDINEDGFAAHLIKKNSRITKKANRYKMS